MHLQFEDSASPGNEVSVEFYRVLGGFLFFGTGVLLLFHCSSASRKRRTQIQHSDAENSSASGSDAGKERKSTAWLSGWRAKGKKRKPLSAILPHVTIVITPPSPRPGSKRWKSRDNDSDSIGSVTDLALEHDASGANDDSKNVTTKGNNVVKKENGTNNNNNNTDSAVAQKQPVDVVNKPDSLPNANHFRDAGADDDISDDASQPHDDASRPHGAASIIGVRDVTVVTENAKDLNDVVNESDELMNTGTTKADFNIPVKDQEVTQF